MTYRVFYVPAEDDENAMRIVAARGQKQAARLLKVTEWKLREHGGQNYDWAAREVANGNPGVVFRSNQPGRKGIPELWEAESP